MKTIDKIAKAKTKLMLRNSFFSYLCMFIKPEEDIDEKYTDDKVGVAIDSKGTFYFNSDYINSISGEELISILAHEILHMSLSHLTRQEGKDKERWDLSTDLSVNSILRENNFILPTNAILPDINNMYSNGSCEIENCHTKASEEIYQNLTIEEEESEKPNQSSSEGQENNQDNKEGQDNKESQDNKEGQDNKESQDNKEGQDNKESQDNKDNKDNKNNKSNKDSKNNNKQKDNQNEEQESKPKRNDGGFDNHIDNKDMSPQEKDKLDKDWKDKTQEAYVYSKMKGDTPKGIERYISDLYKEQLPWKVLLLRYLQKLIPTDYTWHRPHKKSISVDTYLPDTVKERMDVCVGIDASGSIGEDELNDFLSEIVGIAKAYNNVIDMRVLVHDVDVHSDIKIRSKYDIEDKIDIKGGGGTSHVPIMEYINQKVSNCRVAIFFTDGYSDLDSIDFHKNKFDSIFVISKRGMDSQLKNKRVMVVNLNEDKER